MVGIQSRLRLSLVVAGLVAAATVTMVVDRRALQRGGRSLPAWAGPVLDVTVPVQKAVALPVEAIRSAWSRYAALLDVQTENEGLRQRLARAEEENLQLREALVAGGRLERIAEMRQSFEVPMLPTELVGSDVSPWFRSALLDRGRRDGVRSGMPVVSERGLVGLVVATSSRAAKAMLLADRQTAVDGTVQRSRARGIVRGRGEEGLEFEFVAREMDVQPGDVVMTSGLDGIYPKGLRIGTLTEIDVVGPELLGRARIESAVDFGRLEQAFIMLRRGPSMELLYSVEQGERVLETDVAERREEAP